MKPAKGSLETLLFLFSTSVNYPSFSYGAPCPFGDVVDGAGSDLVLLPNDAVHKNAMSRPGLRRRLTSLSDNPYTNEKLMKIINDRVKQRSLQENCLSEATYDAIDVDIANLKNAFLDDESRAHFLGGIVRLAAHDFMDYDKDNEPHMGPDGCMDMSHSANAGLPEDIWCDTCVLTQVYEANYSHMSKADFWIAAANAVIRQTSNNGLDLKSTFFWGRTDTESCPGSALRLPEASSCTEVEDVFLTRLGLTWTDAVALIGAHTLGRGDAAFSGHHGIWVDTVGESLIFNKRYYEEMFRRPWIPRNGGTELQDWTWGPPNGNSPRFMLNTDMCLLFDIESNFPCCSNTNIITPTGGNACRGLETNPCTPYDEAHIRKEAADAVDFFARGGGNGLNNQNNSPFYTAFAIAWEKATTNGWSSLQQLATTCDPTPQPTSTPTNHPTTSQPTSTPTKHPTSAPVTSPPTASCMDSDVFTDNNGNVRDCEWVIVTDRCRPYAHLCPVSCGECDCLLRFRVCESNDDCCTNSCVNNQCACLPRDALCSSNDDCCSNDCRADGTCAGGGGGGGGGGGPPPPPGGGGGSLFP